MRPLPGSFVALTHRNVRLLWLSLLVSFTGTFLQNVALLWHVSLLAPPGRKGLALGLMGLGRVVPIVVFSMVGGVVADALDRRRLLLVTQSAAAVVAAVLAWLTFGGLGRVWLIYLLAALGAAAGTMLLDFFATFFAPATALLPIFAQDILQVGAHGYGWLYAAPACGALFASMAMVPLLETPDRLRRRMTAVNMVFFMGGPQLGELEAGLVAQWLGARVSVVSGGLGCLVAAAWVAAATPALRRYER